MKFLSITIITLLVALMFFVSPKTIDASEDTSNTDGTVTESYSNFTALPSDWSQYTQSDTANTTLSFANNELVLVNKNTTSNSLYYGSVYKIDTDHNWKDFTFEITFKMTRADDANRWMGIAYHTQELAGNMLGYLMNYRFGGDSAFSAINSSRAFGDGDRVNTQNVKLNDGQYHTIKITMDGHIATHYIDNKQVVSWDVRERNSHLGGSELTSGGFALFVNRSTVNVKSVNIVGTLEEVKNIVRDEQIVSTYRNTSANLLNFPTVVTDIKDSDTLDGLLDGTFRPSNAILHVNDDLEVVTGDVVFDTLANVIEEKLQKFIIPVVYIENETQATKFIEFLDEKLIIDMAVMSKDPELIKMIKDVHSVIRGIYYVEEYEELSEVVHTANINYAGVVVLDQKLVSYDVVNYLHARFKTVWVMQESEADIDLYDTINTGCYGMIVSDYENLYCMYDKYDKSTIIRTPFNVAHRGLSSMYNENSVHGTKKAIEAGATHVEVDAYLTLDNQIAIMHDADIARTSTGTGNVESYTLAQLQQFELDLFSPREKIPSLEDIAAVIKDSGAVLVLEIKSNKIAIVDVIAKKLEELEIMDQVVIISFNTGILGECKEKLPEIPTANLGEARTTNLQSILYWMGTYNTGVDTHYTHISSLDDKHALKDRGIIGWYWTYDPSSLIGSAILNGIVGITNNACNYFFDVVKEVEGVTFTIDSDKNIEEAEFNVNITYYDGYTETKPGEIFAFDDKGEYYEVICSYKTIISNKAVTFYTEKFRVDKNMVEGSNPGGPSSNPSESKGCGGSVVASLFGVITLAGTVIYLKKKREE